MAAIATDKGTAHQAVEENLAASSQQRGTFYALTFRNYRLFFFGQLISVAGTWMQAVAQQWLVFDITHSSAWLGIVSGATALPYVLFAFPGGDAADRYPRRTILIWTQVSAMLLAFVLAALATNRLIAVQAWHIAVLAGLGGIVNAYNMPAQQAFVTEMVEDPKALGNAIALNSLRFNLARCLGPMMAGVTLVKLGAAACFALNGVSFIAVIASLALMQLRPAKQEPLRGPQRLSPWEGLRFIVGVPALLRVTLLVGAASLLIISVSTLFPVFAAQFHQKAQGFSTIVTVNGIGATVGGMAVLTISDRLPRRWLVYFGAMAFALSLVLLSFAPNFLFALVCLFISGAGMVIFSTCANTKIQEESPNELRGRIMAVYSLVANALTPLGGLLLGYLAEKWKAPLAVRLAATLCLLITFGLYAWSRRNRVPPVSETPLPV